MQGLQKLNFLVPQSVEVLDLKASQTKCPITHSAEMTTTGDLTNPGDVPDDSWSTSTGICKEIITRLGKVQLIEDSCVLVTVSSL